MKRHENLRQVQQALLKDMLYTSPATGQSPWKVLVMDSFVQRLVSPVLRIADLRELGVTLHLYLYTVLIFYFVDNCMQRGRRYQTYRQYIFVSQP